MNDLKKPTPIEALLFSIGIVISFHFISFILIIILQGIFPNYLTEDFSRFLFIVGGVYFLLFIFIYLRIRNYSIRETLRLKPISAEMILISAIIGITAGILGDEIDVIRQMIIPDPEWFKEIIKYFSASSAFDWLLLVFGVVILTSLSEEFIFRGFLQAALEKSGDVTRAVLLASLAWTVVHLNLYWAVQTFVIGIIFGFMVWRSGSVYTAIIAHGTNNFFSLLYYNYGSDLSWYKMGDHVSPVVLVFSAGILVWSIRQFSIQYGQRHQDLN